MGALEYQELGFSPYVGRGTPIIRLVHVDDVSRSECARYLGY